MKIIDTNILLNYPEIVLEMNCTIPSVVIAELENIKSSGTKSEEIRFKARQATMVLAENENKYDVVIVNNDTYKIVENHNLPIDNDNLIIACCEQFKQKDNEVIFYSNDLCARLIAKDIFGIKVESYCCDKNKEEFYTGYKEVILSDEKMAYFYSHLNENQFSNLINEYLIIKNSDGEIVEKRKWNGNKYIEIKIGNMKSSTLGNVKPLDDYQSLVIDSLYTNKITMIKGSAGSGKSYLAIGYLMSQLEKRKIDKIIIFCNTVATMNSAKLGYYPGTKDQKLLDSQIGNMLSSKFGDKIMVERLINENRLVLLPMSDIRGFDTTNMNAGIWISEAQNLDISLMKLALQRLGEDSICIIDGDQKTQVDDMHFAGDNNGMKRASEVFRNTEVYGEITMKKVYRSRIAEIAEKM